LRREHARRGARSCEPLKLTRSSNEHIGNKLAAIVAGTNSAALREQTAAKREREPSGRVRSGTTSVFEKNEVISSLFQEKYEVFEWSLERSELAWKHFGNGMATKCDSKKANGKYQTIK
jgi:hypothetical protein